MFPSAAAFHSAAAATTAAQNSVRFGFNARKKVQLQESTLQ
jgi:hypothetical protein